MWNKIKKQFIKKNQPNDDFIRRLRSLVIGEGMLNEGNIELMDYAIKNMPIGGHVVEIGSYGGLSTNLLIYLLDKHQRTNDLFTCDAWIYEGYGDHLPENELIHLDGRSDLLRSDYSLYMKNAFISATKFLSSHRLPFSFHSDSFIFFEQWNKRKSMTDVFDRHIEIGGDISFAYIDGGHSFEVAWSDFQNISNHLLKDGFILLDDSADGQNFGSAKMMNQIKNNTRFKIIAKNPNYLIQRC